MFMFRSAVLSILALLALGLMQLGLAQSNKEVARMFYEDMLGKGNVNAELIKARISPNAIHHDPSVPGGLWPKGPAIVDALLQLIGTAFPDRVIKVLAQYEDGETVVTYFQISGTNTGSYRGLPPTGKKVSYTAVNIARYENGVLVEDWTHSDVYGLLVQLGLVPTPAPSK